VADYTPNDHGSIAIMHTQQHDLICKVNYNFNKHCGGAVTEALRTKDLTLMLKIHSP